MSNFLAAALSISRVGFCELASSVNTGISVPSSKISNLILAGFSRRTEPRAPQQQCASVADHVLSMPPDCS